MFLSDSCRSVTWGSGGSERAGNFTATCQDALVDGAMSQGAAGVPATVAGLLLILMVYRCSVVASKSSSDANPTQSPAAALS